MRRPAFAFILVLGIVVDDAIIVGENIFRHQEEHGDGLRGSIEGAQEITKPVIFAVLTTVAAFTPLLFVPGMMGKMFRLIPLVVIPCLLFSLIESLGILPAHLSHLKKRGTPGVWGRFQGLFANGLKLFIRRVYQPTLEFGLRWRYLTAAVGIATLILTGGMVLGGWTSFHFFPSIEADVMAASITLPLGPVGVTWAMSMPIFAANRRAPGVDGTVAPVTAGFVPALAGATDADATGASGSGGASPSSSR